MIDREQAIPIAARIIGEWCMAREVSKRETLEEAAARLVDLVLALPGAELIGRDLVVVSRAHARVAIKALQAFEVSHEEQLQVDVEGEEGMEELYRQEIELAGQLRRVLQVGVDSER